MLALTLAQLPWLIFLYAAVTTIRNDGSASMGWHGDPDLLHRDAYSADFGVGFYGHWKNAGAYLLCTS